MNFLDTIQTRIRKLKSILGVDESRIKKKLILYFILISVVSLTISLEVILEVSETPLRKKMSEAYFTELSQHIEIPEDFNHDVINLNKAFSPLNDLRMRMLLLFLVIVVTIGTAFSLFSKDIAEPIDALVEGAKKVADGDLTYTFPAFSEDEIGQLANLINDMNANLQELVVEIRFEMTRLAKAVGQLQDELQPTIDLDIAGAAKAQKSIKLSEIIKLQETAKNINTSLQQLKDDLAALSMLIDMYKVYQVAGANQDQEV